MKILIVLNNLRVVNGVATTIMNQYDAIVQEGHQVDFLQFISFESPYLEVINDHGGRVFTVSKNNAGVKQIKGILKREQYNIVHINQMNASTVRLCLFAHRCGVKKLLVHSHNTKIPAGIKRTILEKACNLVYRNFADGLIACSRQAGEDSFGNNSFKVLNNAIDVAKFRYSKEWRNTLRQDLGVDEECFIVGTVCRYARQKNPLLMIDIMSEVVKKRPNSRFLWVGSAPSEDDPMLLEMKQHLKEKNLEDYALWVGSKTDVEHWYSAMDVFLMPSLWEGLGITYIEAQANGLPTFASDVVPKDTKITELITYLNLNESPEKWADAICNYSVRQDVVADEKFYEKFEKAGYDIKTASKDLLKIYQEFFG